MLVGCSRDCSVLIRGVFVNMPCSPYLLMILIISKLPSEAFVITNIYIFNLFKPEDREKLFEAKLQQIEVCILNMLL